MKTEAGRYWKVLGIALVILILELIGGWWSGSLALLSDAFHVGVDMLAILVAIGVAIMVEKQPENEKRLRALGAGIQGASLIVIALWISYESIKRFLHPELFFVPIVMVLIAVIGCLGNFWQHRILSHQHEHEHTHNQKENLTHLGLSWHVLSDFWQSFVVIAAGLVIWITGKIWIDLAASIVLAFIFFIWGVILIRKGYKLKPRN